MKYIRTKDGRIYQVYDKVFEYKEDKRYQLIDSRFEISLSDIVKQAYTIKDLCDEFVVIRDNEYILVSYSDMKNWFDSSREKYGAIWTDKGLIYVAKMNDKGVLELL